MLRKHCFTALFFILLLSGCLARPVKNESLAPLPDHWSTQTAELSAAISPDWWRQFGSNELESLIAAAQQNSADLAALAETIIQAELSLRNSSASLLPSAELSGSSSGRNSYQAGQSLARSESTALTLGVAYEIDLWGRLAAETEQSAATLAATEHDFSAARLSLSAAVAQSYFSYLCLTERLHYAQQNLTITEQIEKLVESRLRYGSASELDLVEQQTAVLAQRATVLALNEQIKQTRNALAVLVGVYPQDFELGEADFSQLKQPQIAAGIPSDLLRRRPDLAAAEAQLDAAAANIDAARAALLPTFSLSAAGGLGSPRLLSLANPTTSLSLAGSLMQTIFDAGRRGTQLEIAESQQRALAENYRLAILTALQEVEDALTAAASADTKEQLQQQSVNNAGRALELARTQYRYGSVDNSRVLTALQSKIQAEDQLLQLRLERLNNLVTLYKVLGGGWSLTRVEKAAG